MAKRKIFRYASFKSNRNNNPKPKKKRNGSGFLRAGVGLIGLAIGLSAFQSVQSN